MFFFLQVIQLLNLMFEIFRCPESDDLDVYPGAVSLQGKSGIKAYC